MGFLCDIIDFDSMDIEKRKSRTLRARRASKYKQQGDGDEVCSRMNETETHNKRVIGCVCECGRSEITK